jgi:hypothetical protein
MQMRTMLIINKKFSGTGKKLINDFIRSFHDEFEKFVINYAKCSTLDDELEHIFWFGEQQVKTAVTCALCKVCKGHLMQEPVVYRKINTEKKEENQFANGRLDYWCRYGSKTKISILIEVKHHWISLDKNRKYVLYKEAERRHALAIRQIKSIKKDDYNIDNLYGAALTILPIFTRYNTSDDKLLLLNKNQLSELCEEILGTANSNVCGGFLIPKELQSITTFYDENAEKNKYQSFPGVILIWTLYKFTRT